MNKKRIKLFFENMTFDKKNIIHSLFFALSFVILLPPWSLEKLSIGKFTRQIGMSVLADYDISVLVRNFYIWIVAFGILFFLFNVFFSYARSFCQNENCQKAWGFLDDFSVIAFVSLCMNAINNNIVHKAGKYSLFFSFFVYLSVFFYIFLLNKKNISPDFFYKCILTLFAFSCFFVYTVPSKINNNSLLFKVLVSFLLVASGALFFFYKIITRKCILCFLDFLFSAIVFLPMLVSLSIEGVYVLNQHNIFVTHVKYFFVAIFIFVCLFSALYSFVCGQYNIASSLWNKSWVYPLLLLGIALCANQPPLQGFFFPDIFESANYSILIGDFLNHGRIPIIEHYGGHMLLDVISGIFFGLINGDYFGAVVSPYSNYFFPALCVVGFFLFARYVIGDTPALFAALLIQFDLSYLNYFAIGLFICVSAIKYIEKRTFKRAVMVWLLFIWTTLSRLDLGVSMFVGVSCTLVFYCIYKKDKIATLQLTKAFCVVMVFIGTICCLLCVAKGINPIDRLREFISISSSNAMWAYTTLGDASKIAFFWVYALIPLGCCGALIFSIVSRKTKKENNSVFYLFLIISFAYFANVPRFLVRHNFFEGSHVLHMITMGWLVFPVFAVFISNNRNFFVPVFSMLFLMHGLVFIGNNNFNHLSYFEKFVLASKNVKSPEHKKQQRVVVQESSKEHYIQLEPVINFLLSDDESFVDFTDTSFIYSAFGRECPVYVSQSPSMLAGEFSQNQFVKEIQEKKYKLPIALFPTSAYCLSQYIDGVPLVQRHYKVAEYLYQNYRPLCKAGDYAIWCDVQKYDFYNFRMSQLSKSSALYEVAPSIDRLMPTNCSLSLSKDNMVEISALGADPQIDKIQSLFPKSLQFNKKYRLILDYECSNPSGFAQLFFSVKGNPYSEANSMVRSIVSRGILDFEILITENSTFRFDIPDNAVFTIRNIHLEPADTPYIQRIDWGYDDELGFHNYNLNHLPYLWANKDIKSAKDSPVIAELARINDNVFLLPGFESIDFKNGNYLLVEIEGQDNASIEVCFGNNENSVFTEKFKICFTVREDTNKYILRPSIDYYWYVKNCNAVKIVLPNNVMIQNIKLLMGD